jgi:selenocysteine-specific elongation factor
VDEETLEIAEEEVRSLLEPTGMAGAPIVRVSSETGAGLEALQAAIAAAVAPAERQEPEEDPRVFRMPVLRRFLVPGRGTVITGIPVAGRIAVGDRVDVLPPGWTGKVRAIQVHHRDAGEAGRGHRAALALSDVQVDRIKRGMVLATAGAVETCRRLVARVRVLGGGARKPLEHGQRARLHVGSDQAVVRVHLPARKPIPPGGTGLVEIESGTPLAAWPGDRIVLRTENASGTVGGGVVIEPLVARIPHRRQRLIDALLERAENLDDPEALVRGALDAAGDRGVTGQEVAARTALRADVVERVLAALGASRDATPVGRQGRWLRASAFDEVTRRVDAAVQRLHAEDAAVDNLPLATVRSALGRVEPVVLEDAIAWLIAKGRLVRLPTGNVRHRDHAASMSAEDEARCADVLRLLEAGGGQPPEVPDLEAALGLDTPAVLRALKLLDTRGKVFKTETHWFAASWVEEARRRLATHAERHGGFTPADARTLLDSTRKWVIPFLEALDKTGFSRRQGDRRLVRKA